MTARSRFNRFKMLGAGFVSLSNTNILSVYYPFLKQC